MSSNVNDVGEMGYDSKRINTAGAVGGSWGHKEETTPHMQREQNNEKTTRSSTALHRDENGDRQDNIMRRPHTAGGGRGTNEDEHVVASTRAMMQYRRTRDSRPQEQANSGSRWASSMFTANDKSQQQQQTRQSALNGTRAAKNNDAMGRPRSAGVGTTSNTNPRASENNRPASGSGSGSNSNGMSYGSLKNRFLSGSRGKSSKLFGLSR
jgi:hypothetical protein